MLRDLIGRLSDIEKAQLWDSTGIDVDRWQSDEAKLASFEAHLIDYRQMLSSASALGSRGANTAEMPHIECDSCGASEMASTYYVTIPRCATLCAECTSLLLQQARSAHR
jgi:hypothetical protein